jgi:hypothetical protein
LERLERLEELVEIHLDEVRSLARSVDVSAARDAMWIGMWRLWHSVSLQALDADVRALFSLVGPSADGSRHRFQGDVVHVSGGVCELSERFDDVFEGDGAVLQVVREALSLACDLEQVTDDVVRDLEHVFYQMLRAVLILHEDGVSEGVEAALQHEMNRQLRSLSCREGLSFEPCSDLWLGAKLSGRCSLRRPAVTKAP